MKRRYLLYEERGSIGRITLNNPQRRNALSFAALKELCALQEEISAREAVRVVVIEGAGKVFSAGHDINELTGGARKDYAALFETCVSFMLGLQKMPQVVIAKVHGVATAAGCQLVAACDLAVAEEGATFQTPGVLLGLFCSTPAIPLVRAVGRKRALEMLLTGRFITAREALEFGLVNRVVPPERLEAETMELAEKIAAASGVTLAVGKRAFYQQVQMGDPAAYAYAGEVMVSNLYAEDAQEGIRAFLEKRRPVWKGR